jgi:hypothetical protein
MKSRDLMNEFGTNNKGINDKEEEYYNRLK